MKPPLGGLLASTSIPTLFTNTAVSMTRPHVALSLGPMLKRPSRRRFRLGVSCSSEKPWTNTANVFSDLQSENKSLNFEVRMPANFSSFPKLSLSDQAFFLIAFIACTTSVAFTSLVVAAVPTLFAMRRAAISLSRLADTALEELPSTMAAVRLSGMEISDLTLELSDLSHEIADGVSKSAQAVQAAKARVRQIGSLAHQQTMSMIQERANLPIISIQPVVSGAAKKTSRAIGQATKTFLNMISQGEIDSTDEVGNSIDRIES